ncbi:MAG: T9SS type A sorting domain-containing protein [Chitinophagaceae bacterium]|nr:T9SS type A sorting domain-containing protein [Chitinophagaceae bacterium]
MQKNFTRFLVPVFFGITILFAAPACQHLSGDKPGEEMEEGDEYDGPDKAMELEIEKTKDPATGRVPWGRLVTAMDQTRVAKEEQLRNPNRVMALSWIERGPNSDVAGPSGNTRPNNDVTAGRVRAVMVDSSDATKRTVWVGGVDGGLWKTTDITTSPANWILVNDYMSNLAISAICQDPRPGFQNNMYLCTGESFRNIDAVRGVGVFKSTDGGVNWSQLPLTASWTLCTRIVCDYLGNVYVATRGNGLQRSTNGGASWTNITPTGVNTSIGDLEISSTSAAGRLHMVTGIGTTQTYRYTDIPETVTSASGWNAPSVAFPSFTERCEMAVLGNTLYAAPCNNATSNVPVIYVTNDGGDTWTATATQPGGGTWANGQGWYSLSVGIDPSNPNTCIVGGLDCYKTTNGGASWTKISTWAGASGQYVHADQHNIQWWDGGNKLLFGCDGGVHYSVDKGTTIRDRNIGLRIKQFYSVAINPTAGSNQILAGAQDNGVHMLSSPGLGNSVEVTGGDGMFVAIDQNQAQYQFGSYVYNNYRRSTNTGVSWSSVNFGNTGRFINPWDYDNNANIIYACDGAGVYRRWSDPQTGSTSTLVSITSFGGGQVSGVFASPYTANRVYFGIGNGRVVQVDDANTASPVDINITPSGATSGFVSCINAGSSDQNLIACYANYGINNIYVTTNGGTTWTACDGNLPDMPVRWALFHPDSDTKAIIATETGVWETDLLNGASTVWVPNTTFPNVRTDMLRYRSSDRTIAAGTHGRGVWTTTVPSVGCTVPVMSTQPVNQTVCAGASVSFSAAATGTSPFTYQWQLSTNGGGSFSDIPGATNATYTFTSVIGQNGYQYRCVISNCSPSTATSNAAILTVNAGPAVTGQPANQTICAGSNTSFTMTASGSGVLYQWQFSTDGGTSFNNVTNTGVYSGAATATLNITGGTLAMNGYQYRCAISNASCTTPILTNVAILTVNSLPAIGNNPTDVTICSGGFAGYNVSATGSGITFQWQVSTDGGTTYNNISNGGVYGGATTTNLTLTGVPVTMNGYRYRCVVTGTCAPAVTSTSVLLTVATSVTVTLQPVNQTVCEGSPVSFTTQGSGGGVIYQWQISTDGGTTFNNLSDGGVYSGSATSTLNISAAAFSLNNYRYRCLLTNSTCATPGTSNAATLTVNTLPAISQQPQSVTLCEGSGNNFCVTASGTGITYQWQLSTTGCGGVWADIASATTSCYNVTGATAAMNGYAYRCVVSGTCAPAVTSSCAVLTVITPASIAAGGHPANAEICSGSNTSFSVTATSSQAVIYQWQVSADNGATYTDIPGANTSTYNVNAAPIALNGFRYRCKVSNATCTVPAVSNAAVLTVRLLPTVGLTASLPTTLLPGQTSQLTATPSATSGGTLSYSWLYNSNPLTNTTTGYLVDVEHTGTYQVKIQETWASGLACLNQSAPVVISTGTSNKLFIFPSPNDGRFTVSYLNNDGSSTKRTITIYDSKGAKVYAGTFNVAGAYTLIHIDARGNQTGIYYVAVHNVSGKKLAEGKVIIH